MEQQNKEQLLKAKIPCPETGIEIKHTFCGVCGGTCPLDLYCKDGKVIKVEGSRSVPGSTGHICSKGAAFRQYLYHPDRLRYPMKRVGKRGEGKFERITWEEALDTIAEHMRVNRENGRPEETMLFVGHPKWFRPILEEFAYKYGTPNYGSESSTCAYAVMMANKSNYGVGGFLMPDFANCKTILAWGVNPFYSNSVAGTRGIMAALNRGCHLIAVDPRCTPTTERAELHLRPIPGTDGALALGMANVLIREQLYDTEFVENYAYGFDAYREYVMEFPPERVETITGVPKADLVKAARMLAEEGPVSIQISASPLVHNINGFQNVRAINLLAALTGNVGIPGGVMAPGAGRAVLGSDFMLERRKRTNAEHDLSHEQFPGWFRLNHQEAQVSRMADYLEGKGAYPLRTLVAFGMNHHMWPDPDHLERALEEIPFFADADSFMTDTAKYADILLPVPVSAEREQIEILGRDLVYDMPCAVEPEGEMKTDVEIIFELAERLGFTIGEPEMHSYEDFLQRRLEPSGIFLAELREHPEGMTFRGEIKGRTMGEPLHFATPTGKIEFVSTVLEECHAPGHEGIPVYHDFRELLPMEEYPLILATGSRKPQLFHSRTYRIPWLRNLEQLVQMDIHPEDVEKWNLTEGERVMLETPKGELEVIVNPDSSCLRGVVNVYHGAGKQDVNRILDETYLDPVSGFPGFKSYCCRIKKEGSIRS